MFHLVIKAGSLPGEGNAKDGMPVAIYPANEILSLRMLRVFAVVRLDDALMPEVSAALSSIMDKDGRRTIRMTSKYLDLDELAVLLGNPALADAWRSREIVPPQDGTKIAKGTLKWRDTKGKTWAVGDANAVAAGSYTVGSGADYANWNAAMADIAATLTGDLTFTQTSDTTETGTDIATVDLGGHTLMITNQSPHGGDPTAGYKSTISPAGTNYRVIALQLSGTGTAEVKNLNIKSASKTVTAASYTILVSTGGPNVILHDCLIDLSNITANHSVLGFYVYDREGASASTSVHVWNSVVTAGSLGTAGFTGFSPAQAYSSVIVVENCTAKMNNDDHGFDTGIITVRNCCAFGSTVCFANINWANGYNNASSDATAADDNWSEGTGNKTGIVAATEFESTTSTDVNFVKVTDAGVCHDGGTTPVISNNIAGIRGNRRPHSPDVSIGADEFPSSGGASGSGGGGMAAMIAMARAIGY